MRVVAQRVAAARVEVGGRVSGSIGRGLLLLAGFAAVDSADDIAWMSGKLVRLRIFPDASGVMNRSLLEIGGELLAVSQFTLYASTKKGNRPSWSGAARPEVAQPLFEAFVRQLERDLGRQVQTGVFAADMQVHLVNDGPVTLVIDSHNPA
ncbi:MAG TPA: D-aminoacyl-tRNA deacylase [Accumulibacter sp.]|uniref:D-aminoacyl-tRNA deacylase n=1 Tax=Accumulibacter sp. TaxID=2053492 RepID=UPI00287A2DD1|nr:D-aminoacyl-tRNA deacylase [Accumulibacter sp.]MDS4055137.1 D-aminoacyl-tRNA deacylase [Accumulibacter sp.]HMW63633.1 D-aminoacyl-tRNA deacylase [Accumulibacter sp.]HMW80382.1 D-aminoacyl-tRNA deacylase [Accumulibacter sp.]HMX67857.1 D-aminoacyl-tRNA deacylase [Accumulibacter sp.]HNB67732.1 D-aminoacyl-tRNA deacylase [Accumulibacter sp.]